jgi:glycosyltransferase involved in cell wall biosynthesis
MSTTRSLATTGAFKLEAVFPMFHDELWVSYTLKSVLEGMAGGPLEPGLTAMSRAADVRAPYVHPVFHRHVLKLLGRRAGDPMQRVFDAASRRLSPGDVAYFWLNGPAHLCERLRSRGVMVAREMINCTMGLRRLQLRRAYALLGLPDGSGISDDDIEREARDLRAADVVFCPNPFVKASVIAAGVPASRCLDTSYGWSPQRMDGSTRAVPDDGSFTVAFAGTADVRKGVPTLLQAWVESGVKGRLLMAGRIHPEISRHFGAVLERPDVHVLGHVHDVGAVYRSAHVFCFPTWEEGGPLVTLEAMSQGCVPVVTEMGSSGAFTASDEVGLIVADGDVQALARALRLLADSPDLRRRLSANARERAQRYRWEVVGQQRRDALVRHRDAWRLANALR